MQDCCLIPTLFNIYVDICHRYWKKQCDKTGLNLIDYKCIRHLSFADDQVILAEIAEDAAYILNQIGILKMIQTTFNNNSERG